MSEKTKDKTRIFAIRTTGGQEENVADMIEKRAKISNLPLKSILVLEKMKGYVLLEATDATIVDSAIARVKHVRSRVPGVITAPEIEHLITVRPVIEELNVNDVIEVVGGPLKGSKAIITRVDRMKQEVVVELLEAASTFSITVPVDYVKLAEKASKGAGKTIG